MDELEIGPLLQAAQRGELPAFDQLAAGVFPGLYDFIAGLEPDPDAAAGLTTESLALLAEMLGTLNAGSWRAGVFSAAWRVLEREGYLISPDGEWEAKPGARDAVAALGPRRGALLDLHLRHGLTAEDLSRVLGVSRSAGRLVVRRLLVGAEAEFVTASLSLADYGAMPLTSASVRLRASALAAVRDRWPGPRPVPVRRVLPAVPPAFARTRRAAPAAAGLLLAAVVLAVSLLVPASPIALTRKSDAPLPASQPTSASTIVFLTATARPISTRTPAPVRTPTPPRTVTAPAASATTPANTATPSSTPTASASPPGTATLSATLGPTATATPPPPTPTGTPCVATLRVGVATLPAQPGVRTFFPLSNLTACGPAQFLITITADPGWISVEPLMGQIPPLRDVQIDVLADPPALAGEYRARLTITGTGQPPIFVDVVVTRS